MSRRDAIQAVFNTAELLENIFLFLPVKDIFKSMRVSRQFRDIVTTSTLIHRALFHHSNNEDVRKWTVKRLTPVSIVASIAGTNVSTMYRPSQAHMPLTPGVFEYVPTGAVQDGTQQIYDHTVTTINPLLRLNFTSDWKDSRPTYSEASRGRVFVYYRHPIAITHEFSSLWTNMHITSPPSLKASIGFQWELQGINAWNDADLVEVENSEGITFGDVLSAIRNAPSSSTLQYDGSSIADWAIRAGTVMSVAEQLERRTNRKVVINYNSLCLTGVVVPNEENFAQMESLGRTDAFRKM